MKMINKQYQQWLAELKANINKQRLTTSLRVNVELIAIYWYLGREIEEKITNQGWGARVIDKLSADLQKAFPDFTGLSSRNLLYMKQFAFAYPDFLITQQPVAQLKKTIKSQITQQAAAQFNALGYSISNPMLASIPWGHHILLIDKIETTEERLWYIEKTIENNWSRAVLQYQIDSNLYHRQHKVKKHSNFHLTLPKHQSDLANQMLKDPYQLGFLSLGEKITERDLENEIMNHMQEFLIELGAGFAFVGRQVKFKVGVKEYKIDLLFYHLKLRSFILIDLKIDEFEFSHTGNMNGYLNIVNQQLKHPQDNPSIGIILCGSKDNVEVDFALQSIDHPIGVSEYSFMKALPNQMKHELPSGKQLQDEVTKFLKKKNAKRNSHATK